MPELKVGLIGCGLISQAHLKGWRKAPGCRVHGVLDVNRGLAEKRAKAFGISKIFDDLEALVSECDVVDVCTPPQSHADLARCVISAGKHLVIEKPMVIDVGDWIELRELASRSSTKITVVHNLKFSSSVRQAKAWVDEGRIGEIIGITREFLTSPEADRMLVGNSHWSHRLPGGRWFETLPHELYLIHQFAGALELANVMALNTPSALPGAPADEVLIGLSRDRCIATIRYSGSCRINKRTFTIHGTEGEIIVDHPSDSAFLSTTVDRRWKRPVGLVYIRAGWSLARMLRDRPGYLARRAVGTTAHSRLIRAVADSLLGQGPDPTPLAEIDYVTFNCDRIGRAIESTVSDTAAAF